MRKVYTRMLLAVGCFSAMSMLFSCSPETDHVFSDSPAIRQQEAASHYPAILEGAEQGWVMDFYPGDLELGGIAYTACFNNGQVTLACERTIDNSSVDRRYAAGQEVVSDYRIVNGKSVMLTFDTYNALMHYWSQPSGMDFDGYASDYEFTFVSACADSVVLRGVRHDKLLRLYPLRQPSADYLNGVADMRKKLDGITRKRANVDGTPLPVTAIENHLEYSLEGAYYDTPYIYTPAGIRFYQDVTIHGVTMRELLFDEQTQNLATTDGRIQLPVPTALERFCGTTTQWHFVFGRSDASYDMCDELRTMLKDNNKELGTAKYDYESLTDVYIGMNKLSRIEDPHRYVMGWTTSIAYLGLNTEVCYGIDMTVVDEQSNTVDFRMTDRANLFYNYLLFLPMLEYVVRNSPYVLTFDSLDNPASVKLVSRDHPECWFVLKIKG